MALKSVYWGRRGEMAQKMYAHMNKCIKKEKISIFTI
jgi:hypothetical protein